ncbi:hypothetical protein Z052_02040 [Halorubrum sp. C191]|uniref:HK97 gp10 family phage protein n=1 Tax=Halorubrum sp. C191 TaxID=1383842 RepID=UPI000C07A083|nr:HK97 gp10 family phage protein [Halorubrum sp. C191]PHQ43943.1 hypothetical protein Z052_02040 [Halorubrum sp. C191]
MAEFRMDLGDLSVDELVRALDRAPDALAEEMEQAAVDIGERIAGEARRNAPTGVSNDLESSIEAAVIETGQEKVGIAVGSNQDHAAPQEYGTDPGHFPPPSELRRWAEVVLDADEPETAAFLVARSISRTGLEAQPYLRPAFEDNIDWAIDRIDQAIEDALDRVGL